VNEHYYIESIDLLKMTALNITDNDIGMFSFYTTKNNQ